MTHAINITIGTIKRITYSKGDRFLTLSFDGKNFESYDSNLPYEKELSDWKFYGEALVAITSKIK